MAERCMQERKQGPHRNTARDERRQRAKQRKFRRNIFIGVAVGGVAGLLITALLLPSVLTGRQLGRPSESVGEFHASIGDQHVQVGTPVQYNTTPPTSGPHYDTPAPWGVYEEEAPDDRQLVHNLEHGGIVVSYNLADAGQVASIQSFVEAQPGFPGCFVLRPYSQVVEGFVVLTAWEWLQEFQVPDQVLNEDAMRLFIDDHKARGPEELGPGCGPTGQMVR